MRQQKQSRGDAQSISKQGQVSAHGAASDLTPRENPGGGRVLSTGYIERRLRSIEAVPRELRKQARHLDRTLEKLNRGYLQCLDIAAKCQEQATQSLNHVLERHALNPAIETVVALAEELFRLRDVALQPNTDDQPAGRLQTLAEEINISAQIAQESSIISTLHTSRLREQTPSTLRSIVSAAAPTQRIKRCTARSAS